MQGSLIIVITRDEQVLESIGVRKMYEMKGLTYSDALKLILSQKAFGQNHPDVWYGELSKIYVNRTYLK